MLTPRERFFTALERRPLTGRVPHFELVFFLTMETLGKMHPCHRNYGQWDQMETREREPHLRDMADLYLATAERFERSAIFLHNIPGDDEAGDGVDRMLARGERLRRPGGLDGCALCSDYCFNTGPVLGPAQFSEFVTPYLARLTKGYREMGYHVIKHTGGNLIPILDQLMQTNPHALHSLDPQGEVDIAEVKRRCGDRVCLIGNVNCGALDTGTDDDVIASCRYALRHGMPGGGYIFSTSNCIYTGMRLARYDLMLTIWREEGNYP